MSDPLRIYDSALHMMEEQGGGFVQSLVNCYERADKWNRQILKAHFSKYFEEYERRFEQHKAARAHLNLPEDRP